MSFAWSFSSLTQFRNCPKQYQEIRVLRNFKEEKDATSIWGDRVHKAFATSLTTGVPLPAEMDVWQSIVNQFSKIKGRGLFENELALTRAFTPCEWFGPDVWVRGIIDALWIDGPVAKAVDWKTGRRKPNSDQLALFALLVFHTFPEVQEVRTMFVWLKTGQKDDETFKREDIATIWQPLLIDVKRLENAHTTGTWIPKTSGLCSQWCSVLTCQFNGKRRQGSNW